MDIYISTLARRITREYNANWHRGGKICVWSDGTVRWFTSDSIPGRYSDNYIGSIHMGFNSRYTQYEAQLWLNDNNYREED